MTEPKPAQLAYRYAQKEWNRICGYESPLPEELYVSIVKIVIAVGYNRKTIDKMVAGYYDKLYRKR